MTAHHLAFAFGYLGSAFGVVMVVPQLLRAIRHPALTGVSTLSWGLTATSCLGWLTYGIRTGALPQVPGNAVLVSGAALVVVLVPAQVSRGRRAARLAAAAATVLALAWTVSPHMAGYVAFGVGLFSSLPQVYESLGNWRARLTSGVSVTTWSLRTAAQLCWLVYAVLAFDTPVLVGASVGLTSAVTLVTLERAARTAAATAALEAA